MTPTLADLAALLRGVRNPNDRTQIHFDEARILLDALDRLSAAEAKIAACERPIERLEEIERRHERISQAYGAVALLAQDGQRAHSDRGILLAALRRERADREKAELRLQEQISLRSRDAENYAEVAAAAESVKSAMDIANDAVSMCTAELDRLRQDRDRLRSALLAVKRIDDEPTPEDATARAVQELALIEAIKAALALVGGE